MKELESGTTRDRDEVIGLMEPGDGAATVEKIAINAVMAGCQPAHLPIVIAALDCLADPGMDLREKTISTGPAAPMIMVNGPARQLAGLNTGICMLGPGAPSRSNTAIGRAVRLCKKYATAAKYLRVTSTGFRLAGSRGNPQYGNRERRARVPAPGAAAHPGFRRGELDESRHRPALYREARLPSGLISLRLEESPIRTAHPKLDWLWDSPDTLVPVLKDPACFEVIVAGSPGSNRSSFSWGQGARVTKKILQAELEL